MAHNNDDTHYIGRMIEWNLVYLKQRFGGNRERQIEVVQDWLRYHQSRGLSPQAAADQGTLARLTEEYIVNA